MKIFFDVFTNCVRSQFVDIPLVVLEVTSHVISTILLTSLTLCLFIYAYSLTSFLVSNLGAKYREDVHL